jgi:prophage DNA circulation protein
MSWKDNLLPASFRGVPFFYEDVSREGGRRLANHEYPLREDNFLEDIGKRAKVHNVRAYVMGDDYFSARDALEQALDAEGSGTFAHPYKGNLTVGCPVYRITETTREGRMAFFEITFIEAGTQPSPTSSGSTDTQAWDEADDQYGVLGDDFSSQFSLDGLEGFIRDALAGNISALVEDLGALVGLPSLPIGLLTDVFDAVVAAGDDPEELGQAVPAFFSAYAAAVSDILPVDDPTLSSRGLPPVTDPSYGLASFAVWGSNLEPVAGTTPQRLKQAADQSALVALVQGSAVAALAQVYAQTEFASAADAETARAQLTDLIDAQATRAADMGDDIAYGGWMNVMRASSTDLTARAQQLPLLLTYQLGASLPAVALAQRIYQDGSRGPELVARNAAPHPLFMPMKIEALAA